MQFDLIYLKLENTLKRLRRNHAVFKFEPHKNSDLWAQLKRTLKMNPFEVSMRLITKVQLESMVVSQIGEAS